MIDNLLGVRVNLKVFGVVKILLEFDYTINLLKNLDNRGQWQKKRHQNA